MIVIVRLREPLEIPNPEAARWWITIAELTFCTDKAPTHTTYPDGGKRGYLVIDGFELNMLNVASYEIIP